MAEVPYGPMPDGNNLAGANGGGGGGGADIMGALGIGAAMMSGPPGWAALAAGVATKALSATQQSSASQNVGFDSSGWNVNFGSGSITSSADKASSMNWLMIGGALIGLALMVRAWKG